MTPNSILPTDGGEESATKFLDQELLLRKCKLRQKPTVSKPREDIAKKMPHHATNGLEWVLLPATLEVEKPGDPFTTLALHTLAPKLLEPGSKITKVKLWLWLPKDTCTSNLDHAQPNGTAKDKLSTTASQDSDASRSGPERLLLEI